jgi:hypothetical protein
MILVQRENEQDHLDRVDVREICDGQGEEGSVQIVMDHETRRRCIEPSSAKTIPYHIRLNTTGILTSRHSNRNFSEHSDGETRFFDT